MNETSRLSARAGAIPGASRLAGLTPGPATLDRIAHIKLSLVMLPLKAPISDAKVLTGRQKPLTEVAMLFAEIESEAGRQGIGFSYSKRARACGTSWSGPALRWAAAASRRRPSPRSTWRCGT